MFVSHQLSSVREQERGGGGRCAYKYALREQSMWFAWTVLNTSTSAAIGIRVLHVLKLAQPLVSCDCHDCFQLMSGFLFDTLSGGPRWEETVRRLLEINCSA